MGKRNEVTRVSPEKKNAEKNCGRWRDDHVMCRFREGGTHARTLCHLSLGQVSLHPPSPETEAVCFIHVL